MTTKDVSGHLWLDHYRLTTPRLGVDTSTEYGQELNWGIASVQRELNSLGFNAHAHGTAGIYGTNTALDVKDFQRVVGLPIDGVVWFATSRALFKPRIAELETAKGIPHGYLCGLVNSESFFDPSAVGRSTPTDFGLVQIHLDSHPDLTKAQAFDAAFAIEWASTYLHDKHAEYVKTCPDLAWTCACASYNAPSAAKLWCATGVAPEEQLKLYAAKVMAGCP